MRIAFTGVILDAFREDRVLMSFAREPVEVQLRGGGLGINLRDFRRSRPFRKRDPNTRRFRIDLHPGVKAFSHSSSCRWLALWRIPSL